MLYDILKILLALVIGALFTCATTSAKNARKEALAHRNGLKVLLAYQISAIYRECVAMGYCPMDLYDEAIDLYAAYVGLKGNGKIEARMDELKILSRLPPPKDKAS